LALASPFGTFYGGSNKGDLDVDALVNGTREAVTRAGYQIGDWTVDAELGDCILLSLQVEEKFFTDLEAKGELVFEGHGVKATAAEGR
jgi:hypothetical protein